MTTKPETFGHEPVDGHDHERGTPRKMCARCVTWGPWINSSYRVGTFVPWPCTSAIVLGLVDQKPTPV